MSIVRVGATKQYSDNWENIFSGGSRKTSTKKAAKSAKKSPNKSSKNTAATGRKRAGAAKRKGR